MKMNKVSKYLNQTNLTEATRFVLPMLYSKDRNANFFITKNFENCYVGDTNHPEQGRNIFLLYNYQMTVDFVKFERSIELMPEFIIDFDYGSEMQVMYVLDIPLHFKEDFERFLEGKYSEFSDELKNNIVKFWNITNKESSIYQALYPDISDMDKGSWPKPNLSREIFMNPD